MRFYVPEWDDAVDAHYDFEHDELSTLDRQERDLDYIWDIFEPKTTPIDGVLISREQVEETDRKAERLADHGIYDDPVLSVPNWLPTISDCGAWGYKSLPFPPYGNEEMLSFYETLEVTVGVTIDHLVLGSGKEEGRLYLDERAFGAELKKGDIPDAITDVVDVMADEWPTEWPSYVDEYEPTIRTGKTVRSNRSLRPTSRVISTACSRVSRRIRVRSTEMTTRNFVTNSRCGTPRRCTTSTIGATTRSA
ncbi:hypothetical protein VB773_19895 [Haloarculaceae archaeon H-GB2-1]|nr:hypothetical protein [Haloarculaceae archaeon H-GB2-1]